jgi:hypothetical protein
VKSKSTENRLYEIEDQGMGDIGPAQERFDVLPGVAYGPDDADVWTVPVRATVPPPQPMPVPEPGPGPDPLPHPDPSPNPDPVPNPEPLPNPDPTPRPGPDPTPLPSAAEQDVS